MQKMKVALLIILALPLFAEVQADPSAVFSPTPVQSSQREVTGTIRDESTGESLPGVSIVIKGTTLGTVSDADGRYRIAVSDQNAVLVYSFLGFRSQEVVVGSRSEIDVALVADIRTLNEVVVVGYGTVTKSDLTGSVASVQMDDIKDIPGNSVERLLQGR